MKLTISHETHYTYDKPVAYAVQQLRLQPKSRSGQMILDWNIDVTGGSIELEFDDQHNNHVHLVKADQGVNEIKVTASGTVETTDTSGVIGKHGGFLPLWYFKRQSNLTKPGKEISAIAKQFIEKRENPLNCLHALSSEILERVTYQIGKTHAETTAEEVMNKGSGVCQDHTHIFISAARLLDFPARYVSGYLMLNDRVDQDASHAWAEVHTPDLGWVGFDVSNGISPDERYVPVATGLDYLETAPVSGMRFGTGSESMIVSLQVQQ